MKQGRRQKHDEVPADLAQEVARQGHGRCLRLRGAISDAQLPTFLILNNHSMPAPGHMGGAYGFSSVGKFVPVGLR